MSVQSDYVLSSLLNKYQRKVESLLERTWKNALHQTLFNLVMDDAMEAIKSFGIVFDIPGKTVESSICSASKAS